MISTGNKLGRIPSFTCFCPGKVQGTSRLDIGVDSNPSARHRVPRRFTRVQFLFSFVLKKLFERLQNVISQKNALLHLGLIYMERKDGRCNNQPSFGEEEAPDCLNSPYFGEIQKD